MKLLRVRGRVQIRIRWVNGTEETERGWIDVPGQYFATALGWGYQLVATGADLQELEAYCLARFPGCEITVES